MDCRSSGTLEATSRRSRARRRPQRVVPASWGRFPHVDYTIKNLRDVEDMAAAQGFGEVQEARFAHGDLDAEQTGVSLQRVKPRKRHAFAHRHHEAEEIFFVLSGSGRVKLGDKIEEVHP